MSFNQNLNWRLDNETYAAIPFNPISSNFLEDVSFKFGGNLRLNSEGV